MGPEMDTLIRKYVPKWRVISKAGSTFYRILCWLPPIVFFRKRFMEDFWTTVGYTTAYPVGGENGWEVRPHEGLHARQALRWTRVLFSVLYLFPQSFLLPLGTFLALFISPWFWALAALGAAPLPAPFRMLWELEAFKLSVMIEEWQWGYDGAVDYIDWIVNTCFAGSTYYYMWPFKGWVRKQLLKAQQEARSWPTKLEKDPYLDGVYKIMLDGGRVMPELRP